jgi:hypothetical protein
MILHRLIRLFGWGGSQAGRKASVFLAYAAGEVFLIVIGILVALYLDGWNENRKQALQFRDSMERVYNAVMDDLGLIDRHYQSLVQQLEIIETLTEDPEAYDDHKLVHMLFFLDYPRVVWAETAWTAVQQDPTALAADAADAAHLNLVEQLADYLDNMAHDEAALSFGQGMTKDLIAPILREAEIPNPAHVFGVRENNNFELADYGFYTDAEVERVRVLLRDGRLLLPLRELWARKNEYLLVALRRRDLARSMAASIKALYPEVRLRYSDISITGPALDPEAAEIWKVLTQQDCQPGSCVRDWLVGYDIWTAYEAPMKLREGSEYIWQMEVQLWEGMVKFRSRGSWDENWGGKTFPTGKAERHGENISVMAGRYTVTLDLESLQYTFTRLD